MKIFWCFWVVVLPFLVGCGELSESAFSGMGEAAPGVGSLEFREEIVRVGKAEVTEGNSVVTLANGDRFFPAMLDAVKGAERSIEFETFAMVGGMETYHFLLALMERAQAGVEVRVILDGAGSRNLHKDYVVAMERAGVRFRSYRPFNYFRMWHGNNRDHRKILVVDEKVGFTGGAGYADSWRGDARNEKEWRDTMYAVRGDAVVEMGRIFENNWAEFGKDGERAWADWRGGKVGREAVQVVMGAPYERGDTLGATYLLAIDAAKDFILLEHAYFVPNQRLREALVRARERGVRVDIILPSDKIDTAVVREASKMHWPELMAAGVRIYEFQPSMLHGKLMVVDGEFCVIGSGNFDDRTFFMNDEVNLNVWGKRFAREQVRMFERDRARSKLMTVEDARVTRDKVFYRVGGWLIEGWL